MWYARLSRRDFIEACVGSLDSIGDRLERVETINPSEDESSVHAYWDSSPSVVYSLPNLIVVSDSDVKDLLIAASSIPNVASPLTAFCRILTRGEARSYFADPSLGLTNDVLPVVSALAMAEAVLHSEGRIALGQLTPAMCKRTLSYAWGRALAAQVSGEALQILPSRWIATHNLINSHNTAETVHRTIGAILSTLSTATQLSLGIPPSTKAGVMADALHRRDRTGQEAAWRDLSSVLGSTISLEQLASGTREERGSFLQHALRAAADLDSNADESVAIASAFIATQVAPGSLEHHELLRIAARPSVLAWYTLFAAIQAPNEILSGHNGLGFRILRDIARVEAHLSRPSADLAFIELKALERVGIESVARKLGHVGEVEVELIPFVTSSFTYHSKSAKGRLEGQQLPLEADQHDAAKSSRSGKMRMAQLLAALTDLVRELPDDNEHDTPGPYRKARKK